jgi:hypothetical protein
LAQSRHAGFGEVAAFRDGPFIVLFDDDGGNEPFDGGVVGEHAHDVGAALDLSMEPFERVRGPDLAPVLDRERFEGEKVVAGAGEHLGDVRELRVQRLDDAVDWASTASAEG